MTTNEISADKDDATASIEQHIRCWLREVVVGLNLCPFAAKPMREERIRFYISTASDEYELLVELQAEMALLDQTSAAELETTLVIVPHLLQDFFIYNQFLSQVDRLIVGTAWEGVYQIASFHPHYRFANTAEGDAENLTNRSPYPLLHILREQSVEEALLRFPRAEDIPARNIERMESLTAAEKQRLFPYLFGKADHSD